VLDISEMMPTLRIANCEKHRAKQQSNDGTSRER